MAWSGPLAVLVNRYSASASEIFAAAIQDYGRGVIIGEPTFGKGTVQSLLDLDDYASSDKPGMGQLKITMAQFFRVNGGSTQNLGVEPDIRFPSFGDPQEYGERSMDNALPWTSIDPARYKASGDLSELVAVADSRYHGRIAHDEEFGWLMSDIASYDEHAHDKKVSLLESVGRQKMKEQEEKKAERKAKMGETGPLLGEGGALVAPDPELADYEDDEDALEAEDAEEEKGPDLLLREAARIVGDMVELESDADLLKRQFAQLDKKSDKTSQVH
jgi:carboxyl-terminal processing protease